MHVTPTRHRWCADGASMMPSIIFALAAITAGVQISRLPSSSRARVIRGQANTMRLIIAANIKTCSQDTR